MDPISRWAEDIEGPPLEQWTANRLYRRALELDITDPLVVANALALLQAVEDAARRNPGVPYDTLCAIVLAGVDERATMVYTTRTLLNLWWIQFRRYRRRMWQRLRSKSIKRRRHGP
jgi:hypothetical protein